MLPCECSSHHDAHRIVLTGGPGAGKTATLGMVRQSFCRHVRILPEAASIVYGGGFPRLPSAGGIKAVQRAIFFVQRELEATAVAENAALILSDRGTVDGSAYWPGPESLWEAVGTSRAQEYARYHTVIHLRTPPVDAGYDYSNRLRIESPEEAARLDQRILQAWEGHPRLFVIDSAPEFLPKASRVIDLIRAEMPPCCAAVTSPPPRPL
jgi:predicted ATPase